MIFIMPAFLTILLYLELDIVLSYYILAVLFMVLLHLKLEKEMTSQFKNIFIPVITAFCLNLSYCLFLIFLNKNIQDFRMKIINTISAALILVAAIFTPIMLDNEIQIPGWTPVLLCFFAILLLMYDDITALFLPPEEENIMDKRKV
jgi:hypothetical protein